MTTTATLTEKKICRKCGNELTMDNFRVHKTGFILNQCKLCESTSSKIRARVNRNQETRNETISIKTKSGKEYQASLKPIAGGRKAYVVNGTVIYFTSDVNRDQARCAYSAYAKVPMTGILTEKVN